MFSWLPESPEDLRFSKVARVPAEGPGGFLTAILRYPRGVVAAVSVISMDIEADIGRTRLCINVRGSLCAQKSQNTVRSFDGNSFLPRNSVRVTPALIVVQGKDKMPLRNDIKRQYKKPSILRYREKDPSQPWSRATREMQETQDFVENRKKNLPRSAVSQNSEPRTKLLDWKAEREKKISEEVAESLLL